MSTTRQTQISFASDGGIVYGNYSEALVNRSDDRVVLALLLCGVLGGSSFIFIKLVVDDIRPLQLAASRVGLGGPVLIAILLLRPTRPNLSKPVLKGAAVLAVVDTAMPFLLIAWASSHLASSTSALLVSTAPLLTTLIASQ